MKKIFFIGLAVVMCAIAANAQCVYPTDNVTINFKRKVPGLLEGNFTINGDGDKVQFAGGNLQYDSNNQRWQFAAHQYDYIGNRGGNTHVDNATGIANNNDTVDLFGWVGASSTWTGLKQYGISSYTETGSVNGYGKVAEESLKDDWGNLAIFNGGNATNSGWRTLTKDEWTYLVLTRTPGNSVNGKSNARYACATINTDGTSVKGVILFPDDAVLTTVSGVTWGTINAPTYGSLITTTCTIDGWKNLEDAGCIFLPSAGTRLGTTVSYVQENDGFEYYTSSNDTNWVCCAYFLSIKLGSASVSLASSGGRKTGRAVRLVRDVTE